MRYSSFYECCHYCLIQKIAALSCTDICTYQGWAGYLANMKLSQEIEREKKILNQSNGPISHSLNDQLSMVQFRLLILIMQ